MKKKIVTPLTNDVALSLDAFKYNNGRLIAIILALLLMIAGGICAVFQGWLLILGLILLIFGAVFLLSFTLFWPRLLANISAQNLAKNPLPQDTAVVYLFEEDKLTITLERKGVSSASEEHPYSYFNKVDVTECYFFLNYGDAQKNPAFPVRYDAEVLAFLQGKGLVLVEHRGKKT
jgi:hypothetical protein